MVSVELPDARRGIYKATYAPIELDVRHPPNAVLNRVATVRGLGLLPAEVSALRSQVTGPTHDLLDVLAADLDNPVPVSGFELARDLRDIPDSSVTELGRATEALRAEARVAAQSELDAGTTMAAGTSSPLIEQYAGALTSSAGTDLASLAEALGQLAGRAHQVTAGFEQQSTVSPVGRLHLERIDMVPAGTERGELLSTVPLTPKETVSIVHREWSTITQDFESVVTDSLEDVSERGVTEKTELAQSSESQTKVSNTLDLSAQVSGSYGFVTASASTKLDLAKDDAETRKDSRNHSIAQTRKASLRVKKEHKVTIKTTSVVGKEETSTRTLTNPSATDAMRIDYYSLIRKWRVQLYRYGLRMTYDIVIPEPGAAFREVYARIAELEGQLATPFTFSLGVDDISPGTWKNLEAQYGVALEPPPEPEIPIPVPPQAQSWSKDDSWHWGAVEFDIPQGYQIKSAWLDADLGQFDRGGRWFKIFGGPENLITTTPQASLHQEADWLHGARGHQNVLYVTQHMDNLLFTLKIVAEPTPETMLVWQQGAWAALRQAAQDHYGEHLQHADQERATLLGGLSAMDTLTLRREEREEIMKTVLGWLFGPTFSVVPSDVAALFPPPPPGGGFSELPSPVGIGDPGWNRILHYGEMVKFFHQAIEWENVLYFLYPYFWDSPANWQFARGLTHPDPTRQAFVRSGSARVVLTIRPGFEKSFATLMETGAFSDELPPDHPYLTIAQEIEAYARTNYPGIPPANPAEAQPPSDAQERGVLIAEWYEYTPTSGVDLDVVTHPASRTSLNGG